MLELTTYQRTWLAVRVGVLEGSTARDFRHAARIMDAMELSASERAEVGWENSPAGPAWRDADRRWAVTLDDNDLAWLKQYLSGRDLAGDTRQIADLLGRLGVPDKETQ